MALESVVAAESLIPPSNEENDDLEDGEIPSDEDDEPTVPAPVPEQNSSSKSSETQKDKNTDSKSSKSKSKSSTTTTTTSSSSNNNSNKSDRFTSKYGKNSPSEDWAGDVEKAIKAVLDEDKPKNSESSKSKSKNSSSSSSRSKNRKRNRDEREEERLKEQKKRRLSDDENGNDDDDEMLFVRGASPSRREHESSPLISRRSPRRSPLRRSHDRDIYDDSSDRDSDDRSSRHRDDKRSNARGTTPRRSQKNSNERGGGGGGKNKNRGQSRNDRNNSRRNQNDNIQDPESICVYFMQGKCHRGDDCPFSHNASPPRKMELCKFYLMDCCAKREKCLYMHHDFPCKFFHTGLKCLQAANCKFSHEPLNEQVKNILLKHLETAPKEILGDFPRLSREGALLMINNAARHTAQGQDASTQKIPSLFDVALPVPANSHSSNKAKDDENSSKSKSGGKKTRWGSDDDRAPLDHILLLQQVSQLNLHLPNITLAMQQQIQNRLMIQQCLKDIQNKNMEFYSENVQGSPAEQLFAQALPKLNNDAIQKDNDSAAAGDKNKLSDNSGVSLPNNLDIRAFIGQNTAKNIQFSNLADEAANWAKTKFDEESDKEEESGLVIEVPVDEDEDGKNKEKEEEEEEEEENIIKPDDDTSKLINNVSSNEPNGQVNEQENPLSHLPSKAQELFLRIQQQQRSMAQDDATKALSAVESAMKDQEEWYSDDSDDDNDRNINDDDDDDDDDDGNLQIVIKDNQSEKSDQESPQKESPEKSLIQPSIIPQPAVIVDTLGDLSKIDISAEVTKLLSSIKPQGSSLLNKKSPNHESSSTTTTTIKNSNNNNDDNNKINQSSSPDHTSSRIKIDNDTSSPMNSPSTSTIPVSRDPRMSRDPRQRRLEDNSSTVKPTSPSRNEVKKETKSLRLETSIYSSGITSMDAGDVDFRARLDQDHRRQDMDLRQRFQDFGDTDLRLAGNSSNNFDSTLRSDIDLRQILTLPFKPAPTHVPCTEIDGSLASHSPVQYKVYVVDIPRPNYTGLKLSKNDGAVKYDPRLRKIFRLSKADIADSPMSPPPVKPDTPKSPPPSSSSSLQLSHQQQQQQAHSPQVPIRVDPRRKALEIANQVQGGGQSGEMPMGIGALGALGQNPMMAGLGQNAMLGGMMQSANMGMAMGPNGPMINPSQISFDPHYNNGLLGPAPLGYSDGPSYDGPGYQGGNYGNFGPCQGNDTIMGYGQNQMNYGGNDWSNNNNNNNNSNNNQGPMRRGGRMRRRNRNKPNLGPGNRGNRSPM